MKKKYLSIFFIFLCLFTLISCNSNTNQSSTTIKSGNYTEAIGFTFHYYRSDFDYDNYNMWIWENGKDGADYSFDGTDDYGAYMTFLWSDWSTNVESNGINFIVKEAKTWSENPVKDVEADRSVSFKNMVFSTVDGLYHVYLKSGDATVYGEKQEVGDEITQAEFKVDYGTKNIRLYITTNAKYKSIVVKKGTEEILNTTSDDSNFIKKTDTKIEYNFNNTLPDFTKNYIATVTFDESGKIKTTKVDLSKLYSSQQFDSEYTYSGELGAIYSKMSTTFKVWSPVSTKIELRIYETGSPVSTTINGTNVTFDGGSNEYKSYEMTKGSKGVFEYTVGGDIEGKYYTYVVSNSTYSNIEIVDPYAKSTGINGLRGMVVDFSKTNPEGWDNVKVLEYKAQSLTVYETHIADLTSSSTWGGTKENSKTFVGFYESGTTYSDGKTSVKTGFDHIKELGVNAVQLLPIFDQANDERKETTTFNWGYNPLNYNTLEGSYSTNPYDGYTRIKEFKELVKAYNEAGINIIMDVVYNHVNSLAKSNFDVLMPKYYFRYLNDSASNGSGCGNETASEMPMFSKFMVDSTYFLASEYKLGGFRFDLMGLHDVDTMNKIALNLHTNLSEYITVYGEPWTGGTTTLSAKDQATQTNLSKFNGFGCFNDKLRDALIKGGLSAKTEKGWVTESTKTSSTTSIVNGLKGFIMNGISNDPSLAVNYVTCHDNYTLYDRIKAAGITDEDTIKKMAVLANSVVFTSQGITFMQAGEEFLRTKGGNSNSYNATYKVNELDYSLKVKNIDVFKNYQKLISLKHNSNLFAKTQEECNNLTINVDTTGSLIYFDLTDEVNKVTYRIAFANGFTNGPDRVVDFSGYTLYLDTLNQDDLNLSSSTKISAYQTIIAYKSIE